MQSTTESEKLLFTEFYFNTYTLRNIRKFKKILCYKSSEKFDIYDIF